ncbi:MAG: secretin N-terminal domain-containing protein [Pseudomonadota bacterium]
MFLSISLFFLSLLFLTEIGASAEKQYNIEFKNADLSGAVRLLAQMEGRNIVVPDGVNAKVNARFKNIYIKDAMDAILKTHGFGIVTEKNIMQVMPRKELMSLGEDLITEPFYLKYAKANEILPHVQSLISERGSAIADERTNSIHVRDSKVALDNIIFMIDNLDKKEPQVLIEAKIIDASSDFVRSLGIQWGVTKTGGTVQTAGLTAVGTADSGRALILNAPATSLNSGPPLGGLGLILGSFRGILTDFQLSAAEQKGEIDILSRPSIVTLNNQQASIRSGVKFYVRTSGDVTIGTGGGGGGGTSAGTAVGSSGTLQEIDTGIELKVTPQITTGGLVKLTIAATESEADFSRAIQGIPAVIDSTATTTVLLKDGDTTIIGGLFRVRDAKSVKGVPGLYKIPIIGNLFKSKTSINNRTELLIFITPSIVQNVVKSLPHFQEPQSILGVFPSKEQKEKIKEEKKEEKKKSSRSKRRRRHR